LAVQSTLPPTGTNELLERLSDFIPDEFINSELAFPRFAGQRRSFVPAQLWRTHLLALVSSAHSFNAVVRLLPEQRAWRRFAHLSQRHCTPDVRMLHEFRQHAGVTGLRAINDYLVRRLLKWIPKDSLSVAIIDATDLPAASADKKKTEVSGRHNALPWARARAKPATLNFMSGSKSIRCVFGCEHIGPPSC
jgi:hypothetical protein